MDPSLPDAPDNDAPWYWQLLGPASFLASLGGYFVAERDLVVFGYVVLVPSLLYLAAITRAVLRGSLRAERWGRSAIVASWLWVGLVPLRSAEARALPMVVLFGAITAAGLAVAVRAARTYRTG